MKLAEYTTTNADKPALLLRLGKQEAIIVYGLLKTAQRFTPMTPDTDRLRVNMRNMMRCFKQPSVQEWMNDGEIESPLCVPKTNEGCPES